MDNHILQRTGNTSLKFDGDVIAESKPEPGSGKKGRDPPGATGLPVLLLKGSCGQAMLFPLGLIDSIFGRTSTETFPAARGCKNRQAQALASQWHPTPLTLS
jgi:hypothetical protein